MKKILAILLIVPSLLVGQIKVKNLPTTTTGTMHDYLIKDDSAGTTGSTKKINMTNFVNTYVIPYASGGGISGSGTLGFFPKFTSSSAIGNSLFKDISSTTPVFKFYKSDLTTEVGAMRFDDYQNVYLGYEAGVVNDVGGGGIENVFIGSEAGAGNTVGPLNVFIGKRASTGNIDGGSIVAIGPGANLVNQHGSNIIAIGHHAGQNSIVGSNIWIGYHSGANSTTATFAVAVGVQSLMFFEGNGSVSVGYRSMISSTNAVECTAIGNSTLYLNQTGRRTVAIGEGSMYSNLTGSYSTSVGYLSGYNSLGDGNVFLGYEAGFSETGSNKLYISNSSTSSPLIKGDFNTSNITINGSLDVTTPPTDSTGLTRGKFWIGVGGIVHWKY